VDSYKTKLIKVNVFLLWQTFDCKIKLEVKTTLQRLAVSSVFSSLFEKYNKLENIINKAKKYIKKRNTVFGWNQERESGTLRGL